MAGGSGMSGPGQVITTGGGAWSKPQNLFEAISRIQSLYAVERMGSAIPQEFFLFNEKFGFWEVGARSVLWDTVLVFFFVPLSMGAIDQIIPIFGSRVPNLFDQCFALVMAGAFTLCTNMLIALSLGRCYFGKVPILAIRNLYSGIITANVVKVGVLFLFYHLAFDFLTAERVSAVFEMSWIVLRGFMTEAEVLSAAQWILDLRVVIWKSAYAVIGITLISLLIPFFFFLYGKGQARKERNLQEKYGLV